MDAAGTGNLVVAGALGTAIVLKEILPFLLKSRNGNGLERKMDTLISQSEKQTEHLEELVLAVRLTEELRKAKGAYGQ